MNLIRNAVIYTEHGNMKTLSFMDVIYGLAHQGKTLYGFDIKVGYELSSEPSWKR
ncbi:hypothetical protein JG688_00014112 [Phytophthora aleatoria]|uniref:Uncharacterized protein n=1 Tax=Phytophthora aleatoria TaxID=2496075 RepID=A0A8J5J0W6_9STRA|nr:hypothetical protein JG688_00014112 [Phytophthora aleatoria]